jgi:predicted amidohydrolase
VRLPRVFRRGFLRGASTSYNAADCSTCRRRDPHRRWLAARCTGTAAFTRRSEHGRAVGSAVAGYAPRVPTTRIALANLPYATSPDDSVVRAERAIEQAGTERAALVCFPEAYVPGYRGLGHMPPAPDAGFLERAWTQLAAAAGRAGVAVILGTERVVDRGTLISALVIDRDGRRLGFQDKVQLDPSEDDIYVPATTGGRRVFEAAGIAFGIAICHEGWRYPETVRWPARHGARIVFHPHLSEVEPGSFEPAVFGDPANTFHEKALLCRAAENTCYIASVNCASRGSGTTSAVVRPDGTLLGYQPYGQAGLYLADLDLDAATCVLARRYRDVEPSAET